MRAALAEWPTTAEATVRLVRALAQARFFREAELLVLDPLVERSVRSDPRVHEIVAYAQALSAKVSAVSNSSDGSVGSAAERTASNPPAPGRTWPVSVLAAA